MLEFELLWKGAVIGFAIAAPVGPIGLLCIRRTLAEGRLIGLVSGLGAATADAIYGLVAGFGLTAVSGFLIGQGFWLRVIGGAFLCWLGARIFVSEPATKAASVDGRGLVGAYASTLALTLTNPTTILSFVAIFAGLGVAAAGDYSGVTSADHAIDRNLRWLMSGAIVLAIVTLPIALRYPTWRVSIALLIFGLYLNFTVAAGNHPLFRYAIYAIPATLLCAYIGAVASASALRDRYANRPAG